MAGPVINAHAPWKLPVLAPVWIIQLIVPVVFLFSAPFVANGTYTQGLDIRASFILVFSICCILLTVAEIILFARHRLSTRLYLMSHWAKATLAGVVWVSLQVIYYLPSNFKWAVVGSFAINNFCLQHPGIIAGLYYGSRVYSKYGGDAGTGSVVVGAGEDEATPLYRDDAEDV